MLDEHRTATPALANFLQEGVSRTAWRLAAPRVSVARRMHAGCSGAGVRGSGCASVGLPPGRHRSCARRPSPDVPCSPGAGRAGPCQNALIGVVVAVDDPIPCPHTSPEVAMALLLLLLAVVGGILVGDLVLENPATSDVVT